MRRFEVVSPYQPSGDQGQAIEKLSQGFLRGDRFQTLKGVTGSGKTFTMVYKLLQNCDTAVFFEPATGSDDYQTRRFGGSLRRRHSESGRQRRRKKRNGH